MSASRSTPDLIQGDSPGTEGRADRAPTGPPKQIGILTCSFAGDFPLCRTLCRSIDTFAGPDHPHWLLVPRQDLALFRAALSGAGRTILAEEDFLPGHLHRVPMPPPAWRRRLLLPRRNVFVSPYTPPIRGWVAQQILKLAAAATAPFDVTLHADSDTVLIRPFDPSALIDADGRTRLYHDPGATEREPHWRWHRTAAALLGVPQRRFFGCDYIASLTTWRRETVRRMLDHIAERSGRDWQIAIGRRWHFSEYILYGVFVEHFGADHDAHYFATQSLCLSSWGFDLASSAGRAAYLNALRSHHLGADLQSTLGLPPDEREEIFAALRARAAAR